MAKFKSLFRVSGDVGDLGFFEKDGVKHMRQTTNLDKERIMEDAAFKRTRENMAEVGGAATVAKALRLGLSSVTKNYPDHRFTGRLAGVFRSFVNGITGSCGQRPFEIMPNNAKREGLNLHKTDVLNSIFTAPFSLTPNASRNGVTPDVPVFNIDTRIRAPRGATHFKLVLAITAVSDHLYDADEKIYHPVDPDVNGVGEIAETAEISLGVSMTLPLQLSVLLPGSPTVPPSSALVAADPFHHCFSNNNCPIINI
jgi:hypothetical protein